jgi:hypothetical protein
MLMHQLSLAFHQSSVVLQHKSLVHHPLEILKVLDLHIICQSIIQSIQKASMLLLISVTFIGSIMRQLGELGDVLIHTHVPLFQILKLLLQLNHSLGYMVCMESSSKLRPVDALEFLMGFHESIPPVSYMSRKLMKG